MTTDVVRPEEAAGANSLIDELVRATMTTTTTLRTSVDWLVKVTEEGEESFVMDTTTLTSIVNTTTEFVPPDDMRYTSTNTIAIVLYSLLFVFSSIGNIKVLTVLIRKRLRSPSRIDAMLMHLAIADLFVTLILVPTEIGLAATVEWYAGDSMCKVLSFCKVFGIYLSSYVIICISLDRYYAIMKPLKISGIDSRTRIMLATAWIGAAVCSLPQMYLFKLRTHPHHVPTYTQCMGSENQSVSYWYQMISWSLFCALPLVVIIFCYVSIYCKIYRRTKKALSGNVTLRRTNMDVLGRAKRRTLKMTMVIVIVFIICWSPFNFIYLWHTFDRESAKSVSNLVQKILFVFACTNSSMNPIVYGIFNTNRKKKKDHIIVTQISSLSKRSERSTCKSI